VRNLQNKIFLGTTIFLSVHQSCPEASVPKAVSAGKNGPEMGRFPYGDTVAAGVPPMHKK
jgi:hypothetical protein